MKIDLHCWLIYKITIVVDLQILSLMKDVLPKSHMVVVIIIGYRALICISANTDDVIFILSYLMFKNWKSIC